jgi:mono/diheme cytochrome c family protein
MHKWIFRCILACICCGSPAVYAQGLAVSSGASLYERYCSACHGVAAQGDGPVAASLSVRVPDLTRLAERHNGTFPAADVREFIDGRSLVIAHGTRYMPVWGYEFWVEEGADVVAEEEARIMIDRLVAYLQTLQVVAEPARPTP